MQQSSPEHFDVIVIGAGLSGISAGYHLGKLCPALTYAILEGREAIGGTWDLFRYPGVRSDSDMFTLGYHFKPWKNDRAIADGWSIKQYIEEAADEHGIKQNIRFQQRVTQAEWSSDSARWFLTVEAGPERKPVYYSCNFIYACTGYYDYANGYTPEFPGRECFKGRIVHPQHWPEDLDYTGKRVVVIGSGATAVTLVPAMAERAAHVTMLQRSPTYIVGLPERDVLAKAFQRVLPERAAYVATRWKNVFVNIFTYELARRQPRITKRLLRANAVRALGPDFDVDTHFKPRYEPWDERVCVAPDGDFFRSIREGRSSVVTDTIETFTETGIQLRSGKHLNADIIITATGLNAKLMCGLSLVVDGEPVDLARSTVYKGTMYSDVPNLASAIGYINASWTLRCDLTAEHVCRLLNHMRAQRYVRVTPRLSADVVQADQLLGLRSGYVRRALASMPKQGTRAPWRLPRNYLKDLLLLRYGRVADNALEWGRADERTVAAETPVSTGVADSTSHA